MNVYARTSKKYRKIRLAQHKTMKKVASETTAVISRIREQCRGNSCMYATMHVKKLKRSGGHSTQTAIRCTAAPQLGFETLVESHVLSRILLYFFRSFLLGSFLLFGLPSFLSHCSPCSPRMPASSILIWQAAS